MKNANVFCRLKWLLCVCSFAIIVKANASGPEATSDSLGLPKDSLLRKYLVCEPLRLHRAPTIFREGQQITVTDSFGKTFKGWLKIVDGERLVLINKEGKGDTFFLKRMRLIKNVPTASVIVGSICGLFAIGGLVSGALLVSDVSQYGDPYGFETAFAVASLIGGIVYAGFSAALFNGNKYPYTKYKFRIIQTKGFELKRKHIKHL